MQGLSAPSEAALFTLESKISINNANKCLGLAKFANS
jgi:hypothetical protein